MISTVIKSTTPRRKDNAQSYYARQDVASHTRKCVESSKKLKTTGGGTWKQLERRALVKQTKWWFLNNNHRPVQVNK